MSNHKLQGTEAQTSAPFGLQVPLSRNPIQKTLALTLAIVTLSLTAKFPAFSLGLSFLLVIYTIALIYNWSSWLVLLPALLPLLYLTPHSGRIFFDEFDFLIMLTVAAGLWQGRFSLPRATIPTGAKVLLMLFALIYLVNLFRALYQIEILDLNAFASYYSPLNSLRVGKGFIWALIVSILWSSDLFAHPERTKRLFSFGLILGAIGVTLVVLWERGVVHDVFYSRSAVQVINSLLDFATSYRVTALFADMHTGGTAIDGYVSLVWPFTVYLLLTSKDRKLTALSSIAALGVFYVMAVTFSRGVYLGIGIALITAVALGYYQNRRNIGKNLILITLLCLGIMVSAAVFAFRSGGLLTICSNIIALLLGVVISLYSTQRIPPTILATSVAAVLGTCIAISIYAVLTSKWSQLAHSLGILVSVSSIFLFSAGGYWLNQQWKPQLSMRNQILGALLVCGLMAAFVPSVFGTRMEQRFTTVKEDMLHRVEHWKDAIDTMDKGALTQIFGQGLGRFPERYFWVKQQATDVGSFVFIKEDNNTLLRISGAHDLRLGQRLSLSSDTDYRLKLDIRTSDPQAALQIRICHRHLIHPTEWNPQCKSFKQVETNTNGEWRHLEFVFNSSKLGSFKSHLQAPLMITVTNRRAYAFNLKPQTVMDFDNISLQTLAGSETIKNGSFEQGIDNWFPYYDFNHLPWHIKNIWVHLYFELGAIGIALFLALIGNTFKQLLNSSEGQRGFGSAALISLVGFLAVGTFGTLIDAPRVAFLFYFLIAIGLRNNSTKVKISN